MPQPLCPRAAYRLWQPIVTRWSGNDQYGHVNNAVSYHWFDTAVNAWLLFAGLLDVAAGETIGLVVETGCRYARALSYPQPVEVGLAVAHVGTSSVAYALGAFGAGDADAAAEARFVHVYVDRTDRRPRPLSPHLARRFRQPCHRRTALCVKPRSSPPRAPGSAGRTRAISTRPRRPSWRASR